MLRLVCFFVLFMPLVSQAQFTYTLDQQIPVRHLKGDVLELAWAGGLNAAQFNTMDLNGDNQDDLVVFDRMANKVMTFLNSDKRYVSAPEYEDLFPELSNWLLLRDYNCDGRKDIFTGDVLGIRVYVNIAADGELPAWEQYLFTTGFPGPKSSVIQTQGFEYKVNLQLQNDDLPSISDIDGDGDLDILNVQYGGYSVEFHQNLSVENYGHCDSLDFKRITRTWGNFRDCECGQFAFNGEACPPGTGGRTKHAGGKSLLALDLNADQQMDILFSEAECNHLFALMNQGTSTSPQMDRSLVYPQSNPVNFVTFPAAFFEDVDFDGKKDLITSPNIFTREFLNTNLRESAWLYRNTGTNANPVFTFAERNFLQGEMIDLGDNAVPAFFDFDADGDYDMFISSHSSQNYSSSVHLYENTGSASSPEFTLLSDDFLGFSTSKFYNVKIQFSDMNADQTVDLVFTATSFDDNITRLYYLENQRHDALNFENATLRTLDFSLTSTENIHVADIDADGLPDLLVGRSEGNLEYWRNAGIDGAPSFVLEREAYLGFNTSTLRQNLSCTTADLDADGTMDLLIGDQSGKLGIIANFRETTSPEPEERLIFNTALQTYSVKNLGGRIWPAVVNLFNANKPAVVVGNVLGGLHLLKNDEGKSLPEKPEVHVYPNPVGKYEVLNIQADRHVSMQVISLLGQQLGPAVLLNANQLHRYTLPPLPAGLYLLKFSSNNKSYTQRLIIQ